MKSIKSPEAKSEVMAREAPAASELEGPLRNSDVADKIAFRADEFVPSFLLRIKTLRQRTENVEYCLNRFEFHALVLSPVA